MTTNDYLKIESVFLFRVVLCVPDKTPETFLKSTIQKQIGVLAVSASRVWSVDRNRNAERLGVSKAGIAAYMVFSLLPAFGFRQRHDQQTRMPPR